MCKLILFDDDTRKLVLADQVLTALSTAHGLGDWSIGYKDRIQSLCSVEGFLGTLRSSDILVILDIEIKIFDDVSDWRQQSVNKIKEMLDSSEKEAYETKCLQLIGTYGDYPDYQLSLAILAFLQIRRIPVITISTKPSAEDEMTPLSVKAIIESVTYIPNWSESWETDWIIPERKTAIIAKIASKIYCEWLKWRGTMSARIWGNSACASDKQEWFKRLESTKPEHAHMKHDHPTNPTADYLANMRGFLDSVINKNKSQPIDFSNYEITKDCHEAIKSLIGAVSNADFAVKDKPPQLNTVVLLAAAWDPNAVSWFPAFKWEGRHQLMRDDATKHQLRAAINAIGGEEGLFQTKLIDKENNVLNADGNWTPAQSFVENVTVTPDSVTIKFKVELSKLAVNFAKAKIGEVFTGGTCHKLVAAWQSLATTGDRTVDMLIENDNLKCLKFTKL